MLIHSRLSHSDDAAARYGRRQELCLHKQTCGKVHSERDENSVQQTDSVQRRLKPKKVTFSGGKLPRPFIFLHRVTHCEQAHTKDFSLALCYLVRG